MAGSEDRQSRRSTISGEPTPLVLPVLYQFVGAPGGVPDPELRTAFAEDISASGLRIRIPHVPAHLRPTLVSQPSADLRMAVELTMPGKRLRLDACVVWASPVAGEDAVIVGLRFLDISEALGAEIAEFAARLARRPKIVRLAIAGLAVLCIAIAVLFIWSHQRDRAVRTELLQIIERNAAEMKPDGTCQPSEFCGVHKCCTWRSGVCLCDDCCFVP